MGGTTIPLLMESWAQTEFGFQHAERSLEAGARDIVSQQMLAVPAGFIRGQTVGTALTCTTVG